MKLIAALFTFFITIPSVTLAQTEDGFLDTIGHIHEQQINIVKNKNIVQGYGYGIFRPDILINRAEFLKILMTARFGGQDLVGKEVRCFTDFTGEEQWFWPHACLAKELNIISGYPDGTFRGAQTINLAEAMKIISTAYGLKTEPPPAQPDLWYVPYFTIASQNGLFGYFPYNAGHYLTRSEMAYAIVQMGIPLADPFRESWPLYSSSSSSFQSSSTNSYDFFRATCGNGNIEIGEFCDDFNTTNGDGCSSTCQIEESGRYQGSLRLQPESFATTGGVPGSKNVPLFAFSASAIRQPVFLQGFSVAETSTNVNAIEALTLWVDINSDTEVDEQVAVASLQGNTFTFTQLQQLIPEDGVLYFELRADIAQNTTATQVAVELVVEDDSIAAEGAVGGDPLLGIEATNKPCNRFVCYIGVVQTTPKPVAIVQQGSLFIKSGQTVGAKQLLASMQSPPLLYLEARAVNEPVRIEQLAIATTHSTATYLLHQVGSVEQPLSLNAINCATQQLGVLCTNKDIVINPNSPQQWYVTAEPFSDQAGGAIGTLQLSMAASNAVQATGVQSSMVLADANNDTDALGEVFIGRDNAGTSTAIQGANHKVVFAKITSIQNTGPQTAAITAGTIPLAKFTVAAAQHSNTNNGTNKVELTNLIFTVQATNASVVPDKFSVYKSGGPSVTAACTANNFSGTITVRCPVGNQSATFYSVSAGQSTEYVLQGVVLEPTLNGGDSSIQTRIANMGTSAIAGDVEWSDEEQTLTWVDVPQTSVQFTRYQ